MSNDKDNDKYTRDITVRDEKVAMISGVGAYYQHDSGDIIIMKSEQDGQDFGMQRGAELPIELYLIHEREHEIDFEEKGVSKEKVSLNQYYQRDYHLEVGALIAEKLEIRRQFMEIESEEDRKKFFKKFGNNIENKDYIEALRSGEINPNSNSAEDFLKEMEFIKNSSVSFRCDPNDSSYHEQTVKNAIYYLTSEGENVKDNPLGFEKEVRSIYQIGGFDFTSVGDNNLYPMNANGLGVADNLLMAGVQTDKVVSFMEKGCSGFSISNKAFMKAEELDLSGLSQKQAEIVLQTAIVAQENANNIAESVCMGDTSKVDMNSFLDGNEQIAMYLDMKRDIWEKDGTLSKKGDEEKFNKLMSEAKMVELDTKGWFSEVKGILSIAKDPNRKEEFEDLKKKVNENQGKVVSIDDFYNSVRLPMEAKSAEEVLKDMHKREDENRRVTEESYINNPKQKESEVKDNLSEPYKIRIMDLNSPILSDELNRKNASEGIDKKKLHDEIKEQKGELHNSPLMKAQEMRFDMRYGRREQKDDSKKEETKESKKSEFVLVWGSDFSNLR